MDDVLIARALHVLAIVVWIGGVSMVTLVVLPAVRRGEVGENPLEAFEVIEQRFARFARWAVILAGLTGFYMTWRLEIWDRFRDSGFWWMHAMLGVWLVFFLILFVAEPLILRRHFSDWAARRPDAAFAALHRAHQLLFVLSIVTILGAVAGSHGWSIF
jgi:uncharacterized membrane protein